MLICADSVLGSLYIYCLIYFYQDGTIKNNKFNNKNKKEQEKNGTIHNIIPTLQWRNWDTMFHIKPFILELVCRTEFQSVLSCYSKRITPGRVTHAWGDPHRSSLILGLWSECPLSYTGVFSAFLVNRSPRPRLTAETRSMNKPAPLW